MARRMQGKANRRRPLTVADVYPRAKGLGECGTTVFSFVAQYHFHDGRITVVQSSREGLGTPKVETAFGQKSGQSSKIRRFGYLSKNGRSRIGNCGDTIFVFVFLVLRGAELMLFFLSVLAPAVLTWWWRVKPLCGLDRLDRSMCSFPQRSRGGLFSPEDTVVRRLSAADRYRHTT